MSKKKGGSPGVQNQAPANAGTAPVEGEGRQPADEILDQAESQANRTPLDWALAYIERGLTPIRLAKMSKGYEDLGRQATNIVTAENAAMLLNGEFNLGLLCGPKHGGLVDIDLDWHEARLLAHHLLDGAAVSRFGRETVIGSHRLVICHDIDSNKKFLLPPVCKADLRFPGDGEHQLCVLELRGSGNNMAPPSVHPNGERVGWEVSLDELKVFDDGQKLTKRCGLLAFLAVVVRCYPGQGGRDDMHMALSGTLLSAGYPANNVEGLLRVVADGAQDEEARDRVNKANRTERAQAAGKKTTGLTRLVELLGLDRAVIDTFQDWLQIKPERKKTARRDEDEDDDENMEFDMVKVSDVAMKPVSWIWPGRIQRGGMTMATGQTKVGKGIWLASVVATITTAGKWPFDQAHFSAPMGSVIWITSEDGVKSRLRPRLEAAGADVSKVHVIKMTKPKAGKKGRMRGVDLTRDINKLEAVIKQLGDVVLVIFDPLNQFLGIKLDDRSSTQVRGALGPLLPLAEDLGIAMIGIAHESKVRQGAAVTASIGSQAFSSQARVNINILDELEDKMPTGRKFLAVAGATDAEPDETKTYIYHIETRYVRADETEIKTAVLVWDEISDLTAQQIYMPEPDNPANDFEERVHMTKQWLQGVLRLGEPMLTADVEKAFGQARKEKKLVSSNRALTQAVSDLGIERKQRKGHGQRSWFIPPKDWPKAQAGLPLMNGGQEAASVVPY